MGQNQQAEDYDRLEGGRHMMSCVIFCGDNDTEMFFEKDWKWYMFTWN